MLRQDGLNKPLSEHKVLRPNVKTNNKQQTLPSLWERRFGDIGDIRHSKIAFNENDFTRPILPTNDPA